MPTFSNYLVTVLQVAVLVAVGYFPVPAITKQLVAGGDVNVVAVERDPAQSSVGTAAIKIDVAGVPVDHLVAGA